MPFSDTLAERHARIRCRQNPCPGVDSHLPLNPLVLPLDGKVIQQQELATVAVCRKYFQVALKWNVRTVSVTLFIANEPSLSDKNCLL